MSAETKRRQKRAMKIMTDPVAAARAAALRYVNDDEPGIQRERSGRGFRYIDADGNQIRDRATLKRIRSLVIPPAWTDVWICADENGHIQATGRDDRGRKQYRYHSRWREVRDHTKFDRMIQFGEALPRIREQVASDLRRHGLPREKVLAAVVALLGSTFIRVGNPEYARENESYGLTTMRDEHVTIRGEKLHFEFRGKSGVDHEVDLRDRKLAKVVKRCQELPGQALFQFTDEAGSTHAVTSSDVNAYLKEITGESFTAKDFRTWGGTTLALLAFHDLPPFENKTQGRKTLVQMFKTVASQLGNTVAVCRKYYVHPAVTDAYQTGELASVMEQIVVAPADDGMLTLSPEACEEAVMALLRERLAASA